MSQAPDVLILPGQPYGSGPRSLPMRVGGSLATFARRKPLGAFGALLVLFILCASFLLPGLDLGVVETPKLIRYTPTEAELGQDILVGPSSDHLMGTDHLGRDTFSRLLVGIRTSLLIGGSVFAISITLSTLLTLFTAYYIRTVDLIMQRIFEVVAFLPDLILIVAIFSIFGAKPLPLILTLGLLRGVDTSRVLRSVIIGIRGLPYIEAAKSLGASDKRVILKHVFPNVAFLIIISATGAIALALVIEAGLAILQIGIDPNTPTIGNLLNGSRNYFRTAPHLAIFPGLALFGLLLGFRLLGDALRDVLDPRLRGEGR